MPTFTQILCPVDFSDTSRHALQLAVALAAWSKARLTLQYVYVPMFAPVPLLPVPDERVPAGELARVTDEVRRFGMAAGCATDTVVVADIGYPSIEVLKRASHDKADLIVMGTHGSSGFVHLVLGSVAEKVLRQAPCPVLTVPPGAPAASLLPFRHIVCAVDFSEWSMVAIALAASLAQQGAGTMTAVHAIAWPWPEPPAPTLSDLPRAQAEALLEFRRYTSDRAASRLDDVVRETVASRCDVVPEVVHGTPWVELLRVAAARQADLVVVGVHGRTRLDLALFGSTANQIVRHATCPVLTVRR